MYIHVLLALRLFQVLSTELRTRVSLALSVMNESKGDYVVSAAQKLHCHCDCKKRTPEFVNKIHG